MDFQILFFCWIRKTRHTEFSQDAILILFRLQILYADALVEPSE